MRRDEPRGLPEPKGSFEPDSGPRVAVYEYALAVASSATPRRPVPMNSTISAAAIHKKARQHEGFEIGYETDAQHGWSSASAAAARPCVIRPAARQLDGFV